MKKFIKEAPEDKKKTKLADRPLSWEDIFNHPDTPTSKGSLTTAKPTNQSDLPAAKEFGKKAEVGKVGKAHHAAVRSGASAMSQFMNTAQDVDDEVETNHEFVEPKPPEPTTLPAVQNKSLIQQKTELALKKMDITWHQIKDLPGYAIKQIRGSFRPLFKHYMNAQLEDIDVATTLGGDSSMTDMSHLIGYLGRHGTKSDDFSLEAFGIDPAEYHVEKAMIYYLNDDVYMIIKEKLAGQTNYYVYTAKANQQNPEQKKLR